MSHCSTPVGTPGLAQCQSSQDLDVYKKGIYTSKNLGNYPLHIHEAERINQDLTAQQPVGNRSCGLLTDIHTYTTTDFYTFLGFILPWYINSIYLGAVNICSFICVDIYFGKRVDESKLKLIWYSRASNRWSSLSQRAIKEYQTNRRGIKTLRVPLTLWWRLDLIAQQMGQVW